MILIRRLVTIFSIILICGLFEILLLEPEWYYGLMALLEIAVIAFLLWLSWKKIDVRAIWSLIITPFFFVGFSFIFIFFAEGWLLKQFIILVVVFLWWVFIENVFLFFYQPVRYQPYSLENITSYLNLITVFLMSASFYSLILFLGFSSLLLLIFVFLISLLLVLQMIAINKIALRKNLALVIVLALLMAEMFWVTKFLPSSYLVNGLILAIGYYFLTGITRHWFLESLDKKVLKRYLGISCTILFIVVLTAHWA
ncbi:MAG: hypothetical protein COT24_01220 [Candidatus Kerfeldbacteria bacterium CG08_land_8_20_14_0_20_40_16]|uniref:Uncharacterized protein n=1 Tax=Candidatus Kerfeldbacteria bacterium CG08_land_8_20_14_0_20_40_16 TaxID=2014244 RepID=A0A2H0YYR5_9BACT|nr:MAG: hypothetical protein COT24_01220 [Candidatus Kerfeldbacteria bacterium CG08_land_8_20_14_0_20_40_16]